MDLRPIALDDGAILHAPSDDEDAPVPPSGALAARPPCGCFESFSDVGGDPSGLSGHSGASLGSRTPKRLGGNPVAPPSQRLRTDSQKAQDGEDEEFRGRHKFPYAPAPGSTELEAGRDMQHATRFPLVV